MLCPSSWSRFRGFGTGDLLPGWLKSGAGVARVERAGPRVTFQGVDLRASANVTLGAREPGGEECAHHLGGELGADHAGTEGEHVQVVILDALPSAEGIVGHRGSHVRELTRGHGHANPAA